MLGDGGVREKRGSGISWHVFLSNVGDLSSAWTPMKNTFLLSGHIFNSPDYPQSIR